MNGVTTTKFDGHVSHITTIQGRDKTGGRCTLYSIGELNEFIGDFTKHPRVDGDIGIYIDDEGGQWMPLSPLADRLGIGEALLKSFENITQIQGRDKIGRETVLFNIKDAENVLSVFRLIPHVDRSGIYIDEDGTEWQQIDRAAVRFGVSRSTLERSVITIRDGMNHRNIKVKLCRVKDVEALLEQQSSGRIIIAYERSDSPNEDILGKTYTHNGTSFTALGIQKEFSNLKSDTHSNASERVLAIEFVGGTACITKIQIGDEVITGSSTIFKHIVYGGQSMSTWRTFWGLAQECKIPKLIVKHHAEPYRAPHPEWFRKFPVQNGRICEHYAPELCDLIRQAVRDKRL